MRFCGKEKAKRARSQQSRVVSVSFVLSLTLLTLASLVIKSTYKHSNNPKGFILVSVVAVVVAGAVAVVVILILLFTQ